MSTVTITVFVSDLVGSTELLRHGPETFDEIRRAHLLAVRRVIGEHGGNEVKTTGDGILATFTSAAEATSAAVAAQVAVAALQRRDHRQPDVRIGIACGEATSEDDDWYGRPVIEAARLCAAAGGGQILATAVLDALVGGRGGHRFLPRGELVLKGFDTPTGVVEVGWSAPDRRTPLPPAVEAALVGSLVGRDREVDTLATDWKAAAHGERRAALVAGEPGVGKTRLVADLAARVHAEGAVVLWGRCDEDRTVPYQPFAEAIRAWLPSGASELVSEVTSGELAGLLAGRVPDVGVDPVTRLGGSDPEADRQRLFIALLGFLQALSDTAPVLLVVDDLHWAAAPTLGLLRQLLREPARLPMLVVGTYRDTDLDRTRPLADVLADLRREASATRISLSGLSVGAVADFMAALAGHDLGVDGMELAEAIHAETEGNPFFVSQIIQHLVETGAVEQVDGRWTATVTLHDLGLPEGIREVVGRRLSSLSDLANRALAVAAVAGHEFDLATVEAVTDDADSDLLVAIEEAIGAQLVRELPGAVGRLAFVHALVRQTLLAELTAVRRARLHRRIAEAHAARPTPDSVMCAHHFIEGATAGTVSEAAWWTARAIDERWGTLTFVDEGIELADRALQALDLSDEPLDHERAVLLARKSIYVQLQGKTNEAKALADVAVDHARRAGDAEAMATAVDARVSWGRAGVPDPAAGELLDEAITMIGDTNKGRLAGLLAIRALWRAVNQNEGAAADDDARRAAELAWEELSGLELRRVLATRPLVLQGSADIATQREALEQVRKARALLPPDQQNTRTFDDERIAIVLAMQEGHRVDVEAILAQDATLDTPQAVNRFPATMRSMWNAMLALIDGRFDDAEAFAARLLDMHDDVNFQNSWAALTFQIAHERGRAGELVPILETAVEATPGLVALRSVLAQAYIDAGRRDDAATVLSELAADGVTIVPRDVTFSSSLAQLADIAATIGNVDAAASLHPLLLPYAGQLLVVAWGVFCHGAADRYLAMCASLLGHDDEADQRFAAALTLEESIDAPALAARTQWCWARSLVNRGDSRRARPLAEAARAAAARLGMASLVQDTDAMLAQLA